MAVLLPVIPPAVRNSRPSLGPGREHCCPGRCLSCPTARRTPHRTNAAGLSLDGTPSRCLCLTQPACNSLIVARRTLSTFFFPTFVSLALQFFRFIYKHTHTYTYMSVCPWTCKTSYSKYVIGISAKQNAF